MTSANMVIFLILNHGVRSRWSNLVTTTFFRKKSVMSAPNNACFLGPLVTDHRDILVTILLVAIIPIPDNSYA